MFVEKETKEAVAVKGSCKTSGSACMHIQLIADIVSAESPRMPLKHCLLR